MAVLEPDTLADPVALTRALVDIESVSGDEAEIADAVEVAVRAASHLTVRRAGNTVVASTHLGRPGRVVLAGHLDTVPIADNLPSTVDGDIMRGCGTSDMKSGVAIALWLALRASAPRLDVTYFFYDCEEVESYRNGLRTIALEHRDWLDADFAILLEPTYGLVEGGCQGSMKAWVSTTGRRAHSARSWHGVNAIHAASGILDRLNEYQARRVVIDGCEYREGLNAVRVEGGVASNVIPDRCRIEVNYRFAPDRSGEDAVRHMHEIFDGYDVEVTDVAPGALPGLSAAVAQEFLGVVGKPPIGKFGWTDVARFAEFGIPALNYGPGDPNLAHSREERVEISKIRDGAATLSAWLTGETGAVG